MSGVLADDVPVAVAIGEDDPDGRFVIQNALRHCGIRNPVDFLSNGEDLLAFLRRERHFSHLAGAPLPGLILLDLNMPQKDGRATLLDLKSDPALMRLPVVVMSSVSCPEDLAFAYATGANSFVAKPASYPELLALVHSIRCYWLQTVDVPAGP